MLKFPTSQPQYFTSLNLHKEDMQADSGTTTQVDRRKKWYGHALTSDNLNNDKSRKNKQEEYTSIYSEDFLNAHKDRKDGKNWKPLPNEWLHITVSFFNNSGT
jgi:hypothetical protein